MPDFIKVSPLGKTWIFDLDGTIVKHNGYKLDGRDSFLPGAKEFLCAIPSDDMIIFVTSRTENFKVSTEEFLNKAGSRYNTIVYGAPFGERILINDKKPSGLETSIAVNTERDQFCSVVFEVDETL
ncbi:hypothetical protein [Aminipila sp.]|uniref:hypothetical protein n=1 Tax=Aminipila sp. TaxID=2060095 RepID=UPI0028A2C18C|nr:hypothetical protein [Aminipila sp.]